MGITRDQLDRAVEREARQYAPGRGDYARQDRGHFTHGWDAAIAWLEKRRHVTVITEQGKES